MTPRECARCFGPLPAGSTSRRLYCCDTCRVYASRERSVTTGLQTVLPLSVEDSTPLSQPIPAPSAAPRPGNGRPAAIAEGIATPVDEYGPARAYCEARAGGYGVVFGLDGGRRNAPVGPVSAMPRQAIALAELLNARIGA